MLIDSNRQNERKIMRFILGIASGDFQTPT